MGQYMIVAGSANKKIVDIFEKTNTIKMQYAFKDCYSLANELVTNGMTFIQDVDAILVLDLGFSNEQGSVSSSKDKAKEFVFLQDVLKTGEAHNNASGTKLYLVTKDSDLRYHLENDIDGLPGLIYLYTEVFLSQKDISTKLLKDILTGVRHKTGLYHKDIDKQDLKSQKELQKEKYIKEIKTFDDSILSFDKSPTSYYNAQDYVDSAYTETKIREEAIKAKQEEAKNRKKRELEAKKRGKVKNTTKLEDFRDTESENLEVVIKQRNSKNIVSVSEHLDFDGVDSTKIPSILDLKQRFEKLADIESGAIQGKLEQDSGVLGFVSYKSSGGSGLVANFADVFALSGKRVLIVDLDVEQRSQTVYFDNYDELATNHYGSATGLLKVSQGGSITENSVEITSRVSLLGISKEETYNQEWVLEVAENLDFVLDSCRTYFDIVLVDIPEKFFFDYIEKITGSLDKLIFCVDNNYYNMKNFLTVYINNYYNRNPKLAESLYEKSEIILNKFNPEFKDNEGNTSSLNTFRELLKKQGYPFDRINVVGSLPPFNNWETQFNNHTRYIWLDGKALGVYRYVLSKIAW